MIERVIFYLFNQSFSDHPEAGVQLKEINMKASAGFAKLTAIVALGLVWRRAERWLRAGQSRCVEGAS
jgi:hypothetical protein